MIQYQNYQTAPNNSKFPHLQYVPKTTIYNPLNLNINPPQDEYFNNKKDNLMTIDNCFQFLRSEIEKRDNRIKELEEQVQKLTLELQSKNNESSENNFNNPNMNNINSNYGNINNINNLNNIANINLGDNIKKDSLSITPTNEVNKPELSLNENNLIQNNPKNDIDDMLMGNYTPKPINKNGIPKPNQTSYIPSINLVEQNKTGYCSDSEKAIKKKYNIFDGSGSFSNKSNAVNHSFMGYGNNTCSTPNNVNSHIGFNIPLSSNGKMNQTYNVLNTPSGNNPQKNLSTEQSHSRVEVKMFLSEVKEKVEPPIFKEFIKLIKLLTSKNNINVNRIEVISNIENLFGEKYNYLFEKFNKILGLKKE